MSTKPFEHDGHTYTFTRHRGVVTVKRDNGCLLWDSYPSMVINGRLIYYAYQPALATVTEAKHLIEHGHTDHGTYTHCVVWAKTAEDAR